MKPKSGNGEKKKTPILRLMQVMGNPSGLQFGMLLISGWCLVYQKN